MDCLVKDNGSTYCYALIQNNTCLNIGFTIVTLFSWGCCDRTVTMIMTENARGLQFYKISNTDTQEVQKEDI